MENPQPVIVVSGIFFLSIILSGFWVRRDGKPYRSIILTIHKLISLATVLYLGTTIYRIIQQADQSTSVGITITVTGFLFVVTIISGGIWSIEKQIPIAVLRVHQVTPFLTMLSAALTLYLIVFPY